MSTKDKEHHYNLHPFRSAVFRGMGVMLPPLLTILILLWIANSVQTFVLNPFETLSRHTLVWFFDETKSEDFPIDNPDIGTERPEYFSSTKKKQLNPTAQSDDITRLIALLDERLGRTTRSKDRENELSFIFPKDGDRYVQLASGEWVPDDIRDAVQDLELSEGEVVPVSGKQYYHRYVGELILRKIVVIPFFLAGFVLSMYLLGKFLAAGVGRILWNSMEAVITQLPIIRTVYTSVKQVTDFFVGESDIDFKRVVAVEYPRKGMWSIGFVTGESMLSIRGACDNEPIVSILMPTSPVPGTGFTISVRKNETIDVDIPIEQALQFVVSCGVVIPDEEVQQELNSKIANRSDEFAPAIELNATAD